MATSPSPLLQTPVTEIARVVRFGITGTISALAYAAVSLALVKSGLAGPLPAAAIGYAVAATISYLGHLYYSFGVKPNHRVFLWRFGVTIVITFSETIACTWLITDVFHGSERLSIAAVTILIAATNYMLNRFFVFFSN